MKLIEQIKAAKRFYVIELSSGKGNSMTDRFSVYGLFEHGQGGNQSGGNLDTHLDILWPCLDYDKEGNPPTKEDKETMDKINLSHSTMKQYPAFHFKFGGCGYSKFNEIRSALQAIRGDEVVVERLTGWSPSRG